MQACLSSSALNTWRGVGKSDKHGTTLAHWCIACSRRVRALCQKVKQCLDTGGCAAVPDASKKSLAALPCDWAGEAQTAGMRSFLAVPIIAGSDTIGVLTILHDEPCAFDGKG